MHFKGYQSNEVNVLVEAVILIITVAAITITVTLRVKTHCRTVPIKE